MQFSTWLSIALLVLCVVWSVWKVVRKPPPLAERAHVITLEDGVIRHRRPDGIVESVPFDALVAFIIETNDQGPFAADVFWILMGDEFDGKIRGCYIPQGATGDSELLELLQSLPGFDNDLFIEAMSSTACNKFLIWERGATAPALS